MNNRPLSNLEILDCTIRDGGYLNNWHFDKKLVREVYRAVSKSGVDYVEIGYMGTEKYFDKEKLGLWRFSPEEDIREVISNIHGAKLAIMADYGKIDLEDFCDAADSVITMVRLAAHKDKMKEALVLLDKIKKKGFNISLNAMGYATYSLKERNEMLKMLKDTEIDYVYVADSYGSMLPEHIKDIFDPLMGLPKTKIGFHPHNNLQMAFANTLEAIRCGVDIIDSTVYGMGRGAGNLPTEIIVSYMENLGYAKYNAIPLLNIIDRYFTAMQKENSWGYQLSYMLSGMFQCHPSYGKSLIDMKEYTMEDIWKAMDYIKKQNPVGFSKTLLDDVVNKGIIGATVNNNEKPLPAASAKAGTAADAGVEVSYLNRHTDKDFLILANGPSIERYHPQIERFIERYQPVTLGANYLGGLFKPHYHAFTNKRRLMDYIGTVDVASKLLVGRYINDEMIREYSSREYETIYYRDVLNADFDIVNGIIQTNCRTVAVLLLGIAIVMGARRVFAVGLDGYMPVGSSGERFHFYNEEDEQEDQRLIIDRHRWCQRFIEQIDAYLTHRGQEGVHILTPTSYKFCYKGIENYIEQYAA